MLAEASGSRLKDDLEGEEGEKRNLIVNYLPSSYKQEDVRTLFEQYGELEHYRLIHDKLTGALLFEFVCVLDLTLDFNSVHRLL